MLLSVNATEVRSDVKHPEKLPLGFKIYRGYIFKLAKIFSS